MDKDERFQNEHFEDERFEDDEFDELSEMLDEMVDSETDTTKAGRIQDLEKEVDILTKQLVEARNKLNSLVTEVDRYKTAKDKMKLIIHQLHFTLLEMEMSSPPPLALPPPPPPLPSSMSTHKLINDQRNTAQKPKVNNLSDILPDNKILYIDKMSELL